MFSLRDNSTFWRYLTHFWTVIFFAAILYDFWYDNVLVHSEIMFPISVMYSAVLAVYGADKEFKRWKDCHETAHPGEIYVYLWTILILGIFIASQVLHKEYHMSADVISAYILALGVLAITKESKALYKENKKNKRRK